MAKPLAEMTGQDLLGFKKEEKETGVREKPVKSYIIKLPEGLEKFLKGKGYRIIEWEHSPRGIYTIKFRWETKLHDEII